MTSSAQVERRKIVVLGSTGNQGSSVIRALLESDESQSFEIIGLTRNPNSDKCRELLQYSQSQTQAQSSSNNNNDNALLLSFVKCDTQSQSSLESVFAEMEPIWGVFCVTFVGATEVADGEACIAAALHSHVSYFVFGSVDSAQVTKIPHFATKYTIEKRLHAQGHAFADGYRIVRPVFFYENFLQFMQPANGYLQMPLQNRQKKLKMLSVTDVGRVVAHCFVDRHRNRNRTQTQTQTENEHILEIAFDELTPEEITATISESSSVTSPALKFAHGPKILSLLNLLGVAQVADMMIMFAWFDSDGYHADVEQCRQDFPQHITFRRWCDTHYAGTDLSEPLSRKLTKYALFAATVIGVAGTSFWWYNRRKGKK